MEHGQIIALVEIAVKEITDNPQTRAFGKDDVASRILAAHPQLDRKRLERCIASVWKTLDSNYWNEEEDKALWQQQLRHAETLPYPENVAYLKQCADEAKALAIKTLVRAYLAELDSRVLKANLIHGEKTTFGEMIDHLGVEGFVDAVRAELRKDGHLDAVSFKNDVDDQLQATYPTEQVLDYFRRQAKAIASKSSVEAA